MTQIGTTFHIKSTLSVKMRNETGDEVFVSTGAEAYNVEEDNIPEKRAVIDELLTDWIKDRAEAIGSASFGNYADNDSVDEVAADEAAADEVADDDELTEDAINSMKKAELDALIEEHGIEVEPKAKLADKRAAIIEALFSGEEDAADDAEEDADDADDDTDDADDDTDTADDAEDDDEEFEPYTAAELGEMKLKELDEIAVAWGVPLKHKAGADLKTKKATAIKAILKFQEDSAEE